MNARGRIIRRGGGSVSGLPSFTYTGTYTLLDDGNGNRRIKFLTSGTLTFSSDVMIDLFLVGGGAAGGTSGSSAWGGVGGGGSGYTLTVNSIVAQKDVGYAIIVAASSTGNGNTSSAFNYSVLGGKMPTTSPTTAYIYKGGDGGSGGGAGGDTGGTAGAGGSNGGNGLNSQSGNTGGVGQVNTTREFGEASGDQYGGGGSGGGSTVIAGGTGGGGAGGNATTLAANGIANTGGGGGGTFSSKSLTSGAGASGIVVIRNHRAA